MIFQSTLLVRGATSALKKLFAVYGISIHAPRERSDFTVLQIYGNSAISIHAPRERSDIHGIILTV